MIEIHGIKILKSIAIQVAGWLLVILGVVALVIPGPGMLLLFAGVAVLATQYSWAKRRLQPVKLAALRAGAHSVANWRRITFSMLIVLVLIATGIVWGLRPSSPEWWPIADRWWLLGGWGTGSSLIASGILAGATIVYSYRQFHART